VIRSFLLAAIVGLACPVVSLAQSVTMLESVPLDDGPVNEAAEMRACLADFKPPSAPEAAANRRVHLILLPKT